MWVWGWVSGRALDFAFLVCSLLGALSVWAASIFYVVTSEEYSILLARFSAVHRCMNTHSDSSYA